MRKLTGLMVLALFSMVVSAVLFAGGASQPPAAGAGTAAKTYNLTFAVVAGSKYHLPFYVAREKGWFKDAGLNMKEVTFAAGPVMVESLASNGWDIGMAGVGGIMPGVITYGAINVAPINTDDGTQFLFVRNDSPILKAGTGHNTLSPQIYGDAASWKGKRVLCNTGAVTQFLLIKVLSGFGLKQSDIQLVAMDPATAGSAFRAGEGDVVSMTGSGGAMQMLADKDLFTAAATGPWAQTGLMANALVNKNSMADPDKREALKIFFEIYYKAIAWIEDKNNYNEGVDMNLGLKNEVGNSMNRSTAEMDFNTNRFYSLKEAVDMMTIKAPGKDYSIMEQNLIDVMQFFIDTGSRKQGDIEKFVGHTDPSLLQAVLQKSK